MRLIDLKKIPRKAFCGDRDDLVDALCSAPIVDAVPVVWCSECKYKGWIQEPCHGKSVDYCRQLAISANAIDELLK